MAGSSTTRDDFHAYDELRGPYLDAAQWSTARLPLPTGEHVPLDPKAALVVGDGELRVTIPRFSLSHDTFQAADSPKYLVFSRAGSILPPAGPATSPSTSRSRTSAGTPGTSARAWRRSMCSTST
jgi:hypothetical protein